MKTNYEVTHEYITLGQLLKELSVIQSGGMAKWYLQEQAVLVDGQLEQRRGRKLYPGMMIEIPDEGTFFMVAPKAPGDETHEA
ncbi:S4 domain-containing protein YaaA [Enterococcus nangangensis]|uniref:S4 domain-containing protein YaaA n=1 Tax=Enterococcus nangangensis TaxID=2559926 RepID=UPI0010F88F32|nr:S4 domain-containing protein YaaA [Enterococcus nangangensis]